MMQWYKHYLADYLQDTADLSLMEHGAYRMLMDAYYQREGPLPSDLRLIYRLVHAHTRHEQGAVGRILGRYFVLVDQQFTNPRADKEIEQYQAQCSANRRSNRPRIANESGVESAPRIEREIDKKEKKEESVVNQPAARQRQKQIRKGLEFLYKKPDQP